MRGESPKLNQGRLRVGYELVESLSLFKSHGDVALRDTTSGGGVRIILLN